MFSGPNDHVLINFVDHGAPGLIAFPSDELHAQDLENTLKKMHKLKKYGKVSTHTCNLNVVRK